MFNNWTYALFFGLALSLGSCSSPEEATPALEVKKEVKAKSTKGVVYKPSELALLMRQMYENMKVAGQLLDSNQTIPDSLLTGYETIVSAEATNPDEIDAKFYGFANGWVDEVNVLRENQTIENYNNVMNSCVHCHSSYCQGPIPKIKRLKLVP